MAVITSHDTVAKLGFVVSLVFLAFFYGFAANAFEWFPNSYLERAWEQYKAVSPFRNDNVPYLKTQVYEWTGVKIDDRERIQPGLTLIATVWKDFGWTPGVKLINPDGRTLHQWRIETTEIFSGGPEGRGELRNWATLHGTHLLPNGDLVVNVEHVGTARMNACGEVAWRLENTHHSITRAEDGSFWVPMRRSGPGQEGGNDPSEFPGLHPPLYHEVLTHVSEDGEILDTIDILDLLYANDLDRFIWKSRSIGPDVTHLNDVEPLSSSMADDYPLFEAGDLLVSLRNLDLVMVIDPESARVKWHASEPFIRQHDPDFIGDGWIGVFDNNDDGTVRGKRLGGSRILAVEPTSDSTKLLFPTPRSDHFYTQVMGKWQRLKNGNLLLTESTAGRVVEVAPDGRTVWEWAAPPDDESRVPEVSEGTRYDLTAEDIASWPCSPEGRSSQ